MPFSLDFLIRELGKNAFSSEELIKYEKNILKTVSYTIPRANSLSEDRLDEQEVIQNPTIFDS